MWLEATLLDSRDLRQSTQKNPNPARGGSGHCSARCAPHPPGKNNLTEEKATKPHTFLELTIFRTCRDSLSLLLCQDRGDQGSPLKNKMKHIPTK